MSYRYRFHRRGLAAAVVMSLFFTAVTLVGIGSIWRVFAVIPFTVGVASGLLWVSGLERARQLGSIALDADVIRRVRGDGRVIAALRWDELRKVVVDRRGRMVLFEGPAAKTLWCHGPMLLGGVGVERFDALIGEIGKRTSLPVTPVPRRSRRSRRRNRLSEARQGA